MTEMNMNEMNNDISNNFAPLFSKVEKVENDAPKKRGRPKKIVIEEITDPKPRGRPRIYFDKEEERIAKIEIAKKTYNNRGNLITKIKALKKNYNFTYPNPEEYIHKEQDILLDIIKQMTDEITEFKKQKAIEKLNNTDFTPKTKFLQKIK